MVRQQVEEAHQTLPGHYFAAIATVAAVGIVAVVVAVAASHTYLALDSYHGSVPFVAKQPLVLH